MDSALIFVHHSLDARVTGGTESQKSGLPAVRNAGSSLREVGRQIRPRNPRGDDETIYVVEVACAASKKSLGGESIECPY